MFNRERHLARRRLDARFAALPEPEAFAPPSKGWVRAVRDALGMTLQRLGQRMDMTPQSVADLERSERHGTIQVKTLRRAAEAMNCRLVYAIVPDESLEAMVERRARELVAERMDRLNQTMALEDQAVGEPRSETIEEQFHRLRPNDRDLW